MKKQTRPLVITIFFFVFGLSLSCKPLTPTPVSSGPTPAVKSATPTPEPPPVIKPANPPTIWWGPKPETTEGFMHDMEKHYPDWHRWFSAHPEDIANYFTPAAQPGNNCQSKP